MAPPLVVLNESDGAEYSGPEEYPCVRRFRHRRLVTFLWLSGFRNTFASLIQETDAFLSVLHLRRLVTQGLWEDALSYLSRFLLPTTRRQSNEAQVLLHFLHTHKNLANIAAGNMDDKSVRCLTERYKHYVNHDSTVCYGAIRIRSIILSMLHSQQLRTSLDWELVRCKASDIVDELAYKTPELKDLVLMPGGPMMPQNVLPIGFGFRPRRRVKKQAQQPPASALAKLYLEKKSRMPSSSHHQELHRGLSTKARSWLADLIDASLKAGQRPELRQLQLSWKDGVPVWKPMLGTLTRPARSSGISSVTIEGTKKHLSQEGCYTESARQGSHPRKCPRPELAITEEYFDTKKQRTTGAFAESSMGSVVDVKVEAGLPAAGTVVDLSA